MLTGAGAHAHPPESAPTLAAPSRLGYQASLDGLRAVAVVAVLLYHGGVSWATGGFLGVDVFFVLSGFLITTLLVEEWRATGGIAVGAFYGRRARRLFPAMVPVLAAIAAYALLLAPESQVAQLRGEVVATLLYVNNWHLVLQDVGYFDAFLAPSPLTHTWSLAVEEQWYLVWPLVVAVLLGRRRRRSSLRRAALVAAALCVGSAVWMAVLATPGSDPSRVYYGTDTRAQELLFGSLVAFAFAARGTLLVPTRWRGALDVAGVAAMAVILWWCVVVDDAARWLYEGGMLAVSGLVAVVVLAALQPGGAVRRVLGARPLQVVGLGSYALYLWHLPVYVILSAERTGLDGSALLALRLTVTAVLAAASYRLLEHPVRLRRWSLARMLTVGPAVAVLALGALFLADDDAPPDIATIAQRPVESAGANETGEPGETGETGEVADPFAFDPSRNPMPALTPSDGNRVAIMGDSLALTLSWGFPQRSDPDRTVLWDHSMLGCSLFEGERVWGEERTDGGPQCEPSRRYRQVWLEQFRPDVVAVLSGVWETWDKVVDGRRLEVGDPAFDRWFGAELDRLIAQIDGVGGRTVLLTAPCNERPRDLAGNDPPENDERRVEHLNRLYRRAAARWGDAAAVVDLAERVCPDGRYDPTFRQPDGVHFSPQGAARLRRWLFPQLAALRRDG